MTYAMQPFPTLNDPDPKDLMDAINQMARIRLNDIANATNANANVNNIASTGVIACTATGVNTLQLTQNANQVVISGYSNYQQFSFVAPANTSGLVTVNVNLIGAIPLYTSDGVTQAGNNTLTGGALYNITYNSALNTGAGGCQIMSGVPAATPPAVIVASVQGAFKNLALSATGTSTNTTITADEIVLETSGNAYYTARSVNLTLALTGAGANGLDTGTVATSTWYSVWVIYNGTTTAALASLSATAPTMPTGYTYAARVGWVRTDSGSKYPLKFMQFGRRVQYSPAAGSNLTGLPQMATGVQGTYSSTAPTWAAIATGNFVPSTASEIIVYLNNNTNNGSQGRCALAPNNGYTGWGTSTNPSFGAGVGANVAAPYSMILESTNDYYTSDSSNQLLSCIGWIDNI
jgi:hypothetical protein